MSAPATNLSADQLARYSRHLVLREVGLSGQEKLADARVLVIGLGGLGSPVGLYLAAAGVGTLGLAEMDRVEAHNLQRQVLHDTDHIGKPKMESGRQRLCALNPDLRIEPHPGGITTDNAVDLIGQYDLVIDGSDNFPTRYLVNDAAFLAGKPLIYGSIFQFEGQVSLFHPASGAPCYRCLFPRMPEPGAVPNCDEAGVFGALCGVIGSYQSMEAIKWIVGIGESLAGRLLVFDALSARIRTLNLKRDPRCPLCGENPEIRSIEDGNYAFSCEVPSTESAVSTLPDPSVSAETHPLELTVEDAAARRNLPEPDRPLFLDVREPYEVGICTIEGSRNLPLGQIRQRYAELPRDRPILAYCHHGMRSLRATEFLRSQGYDAVSNIAGGIDAWAERIDPQMRRY